MEYIKKLYEIKNHYQPLAHHMEAVIYEPVDPDERAEVAVVVMHSDSNYYQFIPCPELAKRGFYVLAANVSNMKMPLEKKVAEVGVYVDYLRSIPGIKKVVLLGHSGGATLMSCYMAIAENGNQVFQGDEKIVKLPDMKPLDLPDGVMFLDSNWGNGVMNLLSIDPRITDETTTKGMLNDFDLFDPANGYDPAGSHYSKEFIARYNKAQEERFNKIIDKVLERCAALDAGDGDFIEDEPFLVPAGSQIAPNNRVFPQDLSFLSHTKDEYPLIHADGSITTEVIYSKRPPKFDKSFSRMFAMGADNTTVRTYASACAVRTNGFKMTETEMEGIIWDSSYCCTPGNVAHISQPMLIMGMTGGYEFLASEVVYKNAVKAKDKTIAFVEGATHNFEPETATGDWGDTVANTFDFAAKWLVEKMM